MRPLTLPLMILSLTIGGGCSHLRTPTEPQTVVFPHPDEIRQGDGFMILADRRIFATMAFLNATGFDQEAQGVPMHPVRQTVRKRIAENLAQSPEKIEKWRQYEKSRKLASFQYLDFALSLQADYPFQRLRPDEELGYRQTASRLRAFPEVLNEFWVSAALPDVWNEVKADYIAELEKYDLEEMQRQMAFLWAYLRMPRQDALTVIHVPNLLDTHYHAIGAHYEAYYYCVESPGASSYSLNFHEYLHSIVNPLVQTDFPGHRDKLLRYYQAGEHGPLSKTYREPVVFTAECLVRALDSRLRVKWAGDSVTIQRVEQQVVDHSAKGLILVRPFYQLLDEYERGNARFNEFLPVMFEHLPDNPP